MAVVWFWLLYLALLLAIASLAGNQLARFPPPPTRQANTRKPPTPLADPVSVSLSTIPSSKNMSVILATAGFDHKIRFWEAPSGICSRTIRHPDSPVNRLEITPDKQFLAAAGNPTIRLYEINNAANHNPVLTLEGHTGAVTSLGFQRDGRYLYSGSEDGAVILWDLRSPNPSRKFDAKAAVNSVALHPNQAQILSADQAGSVKVWDLGSSACVNDVTPDPKAHSIQAVEVSEDGRTLVAANSHAEVFVWTCSSAPEYVESSGCAYSASKLAPVTRFRAHPTGTYLTSAKISPDCRTLVTTSSDRTARLWDTTSWDLTSTLAQHTKWVWDAVFSADSSYLVTSSSDHSARLWNLRTSEVVRTYTGHQCAVTCVALNDSST